MSKYLAIAEVDQRQRFIFGADKLLEMLGASRIISQTITIAEQEAKNIGATVRLIWPVSGVLWFSSDHLPALAGTVWEVRERLHALGLSVSIAVELYESGQLTDAVARALNANRANKDHKHGADHRPHNPYFASCNIQPTLYAQIEDSSGDSREPRRQLVHKLSRSRRKQAQGYQEDKRKEYEVECHDGFPQQFQDLCGGESDSYIALIKGDVDGLGRLLSKLNYEKLGERLKKDPEDAACDFAQALHRSLEDAVHSAIAGAYKKELANPDTKSEAKRMFPFLPLLTAGDDLWILSRRDLALPLAADIASRFAKNSAGSPVTSKALEVAQSPPLSLSLGVLFAKQGFPFDAQIDLADELERNAKNARKAVNASTGFIDFHWLGSSGRESVKESRTRTLTFTDAGAEFRLYSRPWPIGTAQKFMEQAKLFEVPRRKLKQLEQILRLGKNLSAVAFQSWYTGLTSDEAKRVQSCVAAIDPAYKPDDWIASDGRLPRGPWHKQNRINHTILLELAEIQEILK